MVANALPVPSPSPASRALVQDPHLDFHIMSFYIREIMICAFERWTATLSTTMPAYALVLRSLKFYPIHIRKVLLAWTRVQPPDLYNSRFALRYNAQLQDLVPVYITFYPHPDRTEAISLRALLQRLGNQCMDTVLQGHFSVAIRTAPYFNYDSVDTTRNEGIRKELEAALNPHKNIPINYSAFLSEDPRDRATQRIAENHDRSPLVNEQLHECIVLARRRLSNITVYPKASDRTIGEEASRMAQQTLWKDPDAEIQSTGSLWDIERIYHHSGIEVQGPVEMRVAWKYNDLKPRVYYANGPTTYHASKYVQRIFNIILDCFPPVHRKNRFQEPSDRYLQEGIRLAIYDYSSFTSNLPEVKRFVSALAEFMGDTEITIVDSFHGPMVVLVKDILHRYNRTCNYHLEFDVSRLFSEIGPLILQHGAGALGIPGNISSCTLLHGIHICSICGSIFRCRCVGDDAEVFYDMDPPNSWESFIDQVRNLGEIEESKAEYWDFDISDTEFGLDGWQYLKRPFERHGGVIIRGSITVWPALDILLGLSDERHTVRLPAMHVRRRVFLTQWCRLLEKLSTIPISSAGRTLLFAYQRHAMRTLDLPNRPNFLYDREHHMALGWWPGRYEIEEFGVHWVRRSRDWFIENGSKMTATVPLARFWHEEFLGVVGESYECASHPMLRLMEKLGYCTKELLLEEVTLDPADVDLFEFYILKGYRYSYRFHVVAPLPRWWASLSPTDE